IPLKLSAQKEQCGHPASQLGSNMKWYTINWLLPSKSSGRVCFPLGPSKTYFLSTTSHGSSRRCRLSSSRSRVNSFSLLNSSFRAASHSACDTTFGPSFLLGAVAIIISPLFLVLFENSFRAILQMKQSCSERRQPARSGYPSDHERCTHHTRWTHTSSSHNGRAHCERCASARLRTPSLMCVQPFPT